MENTEYTLEYFIKKFEAIPEEKWTTGEFVDRDGCMCAYGHCGRTQSNNGTKESDALAELILKLDEVMPRHLANVNDGMFGTESQYGSTPKQRVVNYLKSI